jgi:hypothetical protein
MVDIKERLAPLHGNKRKGSKPSGKKNVTTSKIGIHNIQAHL